MNDTVLCADIGTTSLKAGLVDGGGKVIAVSQQTFEHPDAVQAALSWLPALCRAVREMTTEDTPVICAVCISGNGPTIVSEDGTTLLWNAPVPQSDISGTPAVRSLFIPRLIAFRTLYQTQWESSAYIYSGPEFLIHQLCGDSVTILPESRYEETYWTRTQLLSVSIPEKKLPPFVPIAYNAGTTRPDITAGLGLPHAVPVFCGGPDFVAAMVGTNSLSPGKVYDCAGSSEGINLCTPVPVAFDGILALPSVIPGLWNAAVLQSESGRMFVNFKKIVEAIEERSISYEELISFCVSNPDSDGFEVLELVAVNLRQSLGKLLEAAEQYGIRPRYPVVVTGGQAKNEQWLQMKCNYAGVPLAVCNCPDSELIGDAVMARTGMGAYASIQEAADALVKIAKVYTPETAV